MLSFSAADVAAIFRPPRTGCVPALCDYDAYAVAREKRPKRWAQLTEAATLLHQVAALFCTSCSCGSVSCSLQHMGANGSQLSCVSSLQHLIARRSVPLISGGPYGRPALTLQRCVPIWSSRMLISNTCYYLRDEEVICLHPLTAHGIGDDSS